MLAACKSSVPGPTLVTPKALPLSPIGLLMARVLAAPSTPMLELLPRVMRLAQVLLPLTFSRAPALLKPGPLSVRRSFAECDAALDLQGGAA